MKKVIRLVKAYDDLHAQQGQEVEADVEARIIIGDDEALVLDLTDENAAQLRRDLARYTKAARSEPVRRQGRRRAVGEPGIPVARHPIPEGMSLEEGKAFLTGAREWAAEQGRSNEIHTKGDKSSYAYGQQLLDDYQEHLRPPWERAG